MEERSRSRLYKFFIFVVAAGALLGGVYSLAGDRYLSLHRQEADRQASSTR